MLVTLNVIVALHGFTQGHAQKKTPQMGYEEATIRWAYLKLMYYNSIANREQARAKDQVYTPLSDIFFEIHNINTGPISEAYDKKLDSLMSDPSGSIVSLTLYSQTLNGNRQEQIAYSAEWTPGHYTSAVAPKNLVFRDVLHMLGEKYADIGKYSTYEVTVRLAGISRRYKAMVLYHTSFQSTVDPKPEFWDTIVGSGGVITDIWNETRPPIGATRKGSLDEPLSKLSQSKEAAISKSIKPFGCDSGQPLCCPWGSTSLTECRWNAGYPWDEPSYLTPSKVNEGGATNFDMNDRLFDKENGLTYATNEAASCYYVERVERFPSQTSRDSTAHFEGTHNAHTQVSVKCKMTNMCVATCDPFLEQSGAWDYAEGVEYFLGVFQPYHVARKQVAVEPSSSSGGYISSLTCKGGAGYGFNSCPFSTCSVSLSVSWNGSTLQASDSDLWNVAHSRTHTCNYSNSGSVGGGPPVQCGPGTGLYCFQGNSFCLPYTFPSGSCCCSMSPIVIDISRYWDWATNSGSGYNFTDVAGGVRFDLNGDGVQEQVAWPAATSENAWLTLDRNGNGLIDSGKELFGNFTDQTGPYGEPVPVGQGNGWQALAEYDRGRSGGNENGMVDVGDAVFSNLRLWVDRNHNGISEPNELLPLISISLTGIELSYAQTSWTDQHGNNFRLRSRFRWGDRDDPEFFYVEWFKDAWDVFPQWVP